MHFSKTNIDNWLQFVEGIKVKINQNISTPQNCRSPTTGLETVCAAYKRMRVAGLLKLKIR